MRKIYSITIIVVVSLFFLFSAYSKLEPLEPFKFVLSEQLHIKNWWLVEILSRTIIGIEFFLGLSLISFIRTKKVIQYTIIFTSLLSFYLLYVWIFYGSTEDCGCLGDYIHLSVTESLLKNIILIIILWLAYKWNPLEIQFKFQHISWFVVFILSFSIPWIFNAPDKFYENPYETEKGNYLNIEILNKFSNNYPADSLKQGKKIVCFFSTTCKYCAYAAKKITLFQKNYNISLPVYYVFWGDEQTLQKFWEKTESFRFPYQIASPDTFFKLSGNQLPAIYFLNNGQIVAKHGYRTMDDKDVLSFISGN